MGIVGTVVADGGVEWSYDGARGPARWGGLSNAYRKCSTGRQQSPINLVSGNAEYVAQARPSSPAFVWGQLGRTPIVYDGHTVQLNVQAGDSSSNYVTFGGSRYTLQNIHFHVPSEHRIASVYSDAEVHLVHKSADNKLLVIGVVFRVSTADNGWLAPIIANMPGGSGAKKEVPSLDLPALLRATGNFGEYWTYMGSLTTPPCTENVRWFIAGKAQSFSVAQYHALRTVLKFNSRFTQPR
ncbi:carbonic anhydrase, Cah [Syncephalis pseudoplumigaleata]|uniref:carbonic anhydrase n=1 Tax=Syncephalis pseudoplumigaleata TaxID=1712513 RepID=A0A4P9YZI0_9FUNG|nr:carbonic anhydrase, Cah [Syncephalis pseudoplumigaleata]|eukprot:RKP24821.1 carbonic anhydrase, Cah [Syncephalis pseudoplumigaleata]